MDIHVYIHEDSTHASSTHHQLEEIMADLEGLTTAVNALIDSEHAAAAELQKLSDQVKSLSVGNVTQDQIDAITQSVTTVASKLQSDATDAEPQQPTQGDEPAQSDPAATPSDEASEPGSLRGAAGAQERSMGAASKTLGRNR